MTTGTKGKIAQAWHRVCSRLFPCKNEPTDSTAALDMNSIPRHIAIIMDGNGRWATARSLPRTAGHSAGVEALRGVIKECDRLGVRVLTIYAFSTENWKRSSEEVGALMGLLLRYFHSEIDELHQKGVRIRILGDKAGLPAPQREAVEAAEKKTAGNGGLQLNIALNYGGRAELLRAAKRLCERSVQEAIAPGEFTEADFERELYTSGQPDVDLLIRTSGEMRLSNFLPFQTAYAEMVFTDTLWPDFTPEELRKAIVAYQARDRRFGGVTKAKEVKR